jgi:hypothetical protein
MGGREVFVVSVFLLYDIVERFCVVACGSCVLCLKKIVCLKKYL